MSLKDFKCNSLMFADDDQTDLADADNMIFLHLSNHEGGDEEDFTLADGTKAKVIWKDLLVEGTYPMTPTAQGAIEKPMHVIRQGASDPAQGIISMSDLLESHKDGAHKYVTIPTKHRDDLLDNTGYVPQPDGVRVVEKKGKNVFQAALGFTEPDIAGKVRRGTIPDVSAGILFGFRNKSKNKRYRCSLKHAALTPVPFMGNLDPFPAVFASDDLNEGILTEEMTQQHFQFDGTVLEAAPEKKTPTNVEVVWNENESMSWMRAQVEEKLNPRQVTDSPVPVDRASYYVEDVAHEKALVKEYYKGAQTSFIIPFKAVDDGVEIAPQLRWVEARQAMIAASDDKPEVQDNNRSVVAITQKLNTLLSDSLGAVAKNYSVLDVGFDNKVTISDKATGAVFVADFSIIGTDAEVFLSPVTAWATAKPGKKAVKKKPAAISLSDIKVNYDLKTPEGRVAAARERRLAMSH